MFVVRPSTIVDVTDTIVIDDIITTQTDGQCDERANGIQGDILD